MPYNQRRSQLPAYFPAYPFGYGLSYTEFAYSDLSVPESVDVGEPVSVKVSIENTGDRAGDDVVMVFVKDLYTSVVQPEKKLVGFQRVSLNPGEKQESSFTITPEQLSLYDKNLNSVVRVFCPYHCLADISKSLFRIFLQAPA